MTTKVVMAVYLKNKGKGYRGTTSENVTIGKNVDVSLDALIVSCTIVLVEFALKTGQGSKEEILTSMDKAGDEIKRLVQLERSNADENKV